MGACMDTEVFANKTEIIFAYRGRKKNQVPFDDERNLIGERKQGE